MAGCSETTNNVMDALDSVNELETNLDQSKESMYKLSYVVRVSAPDLEELKRRCDEVKDFYDDLNVKLVRPFGDMLGLHGEFIPSSHRYMNDYIQYVTSDFLAGLGFGATQQLGERDGIYIGYSSTRAETGLLAACPCQSGRERLCHQCAGGGISGQPWRREIVLQQPDRLLCGAVRRSGCGG